MNKLINKVCDLSKKTKIIAMFVVAVISVSAIYYGFFGDGEAKAEDGDEKEYLQMIVDRIIEGKQENFTILEIVPYIGQGEFRHYVGDDELNAKIAANTELMEKYYGEQGHYINNGAWNVVDEWEKINSYANSYEYEMIYHSDSSSFEVRSPKKFVNLVIDKYKDLLEDNIVVNTVEANDLTSEDIQSADFIVIASGTHNVKAIELYNAAEVGNVDYTNYSVNSYTKNEDGTWSELTGEGNILAQLNYNTYELTEEGDYISRDMDWEATKELLDYIKLGKTWDMDDGTVQKIKVPVVIDNKHFASLNKDGNMYKLWLLYRILSEEQYVEIEEYLSAEDEDGNPYINCEGITTAVLDASQSFDSDADMTASMEELWAFFDEIAPELDYLDENPSDSDMLTDDYWVYRGDNALIPSGALAEYNYTGVGFERLDKMPFTVIDVMRWLLGVREHPTIEYDRQIKILEIQPCNSFDYDTVEEKQALCDKLLLHSGEWNDGVGEDDYEKFVHVDCLTTSALNGINIDIVAEYDVVYIGDNIQLMTKDKTTGKPIYNDTSLNGYIYLAYGDLIKGRTGISVYYPEDYVEYTGGSNNGFNLVTGDDFNSRDNTNTMTYTNVYKPNAKLWSSKLVEGLNESKYYVLKNMEVLAEAAVSNEQLFAIDAGNVRLKGNDITKIKMEELKEFVDAGKLLLLGDSVYNNDATKVFPSSNMSTLATYIKENTTKRVKASRVGTMLLKISNKNPIIELTSYPTEVTYDDQGMVATFNDTGRTLPFSVSVKGKKNTKYKITIYLDKNNDGVFYESDDITNDKNELFHSSTITLDGNGVGSKSVTAELSENYSGLITWELTVTELDGNTEKPFRAGKRGFSAVKSEEILKTIKVLQILPYSGTSKKDVTLNLTTDIEDPSYNAEYNELLKKATDMIGYSVDVDTVNSYEYEDWFDPDKEGTEYNPDDSNTNLLAIYDMVVLGFADLYKGDDIVNDNGALDCLNDFIASGKAVLFTHDTVSYTGTPNGVKTSDASVTMIPTQTEKKTVDVKFEVFETGTLPDGYITLGSAYTIDGTSYVNAVNTDYYGEPSTWGTRSISASSDADYALEYTVGQHLVTGFLQVPGKSGNSELWVKDSEAPGAAEGLASIGIIRRYQSFGCDIYRSYMNSRKCYTAVVQEVVSADISYNTGTTLGGYKNGVNVWGTNISKMFRNTVGMDRYGISTETMKNVPKDIEGNDMEFGLQGITDMLAYRHNVVGNYVTEPATKGTYTLYPYERDPANDAQNNYTSLMTTTSVSKLNDGQVTMYPYKINETLAVAPTHSQWYQLDMEDPSIVVWYTLAGDEDDSTNSQYYKDTHKDAANNYYIYSKGNITYSGAGHSTMDSEEEIKLFINTIIKAITAGNNNPEIRVPESSYANGTYNVYVTPYADNYEFQFYAEDLDLLVDIGEFKSAKVVWQNQTEGEDDITWTIDKLKNCERKTVTITEGSVFEDYADQISDEIENKGGATFYIEVRDMYAKPEETVGNGIGSATVRLLKRSLFELD